jgi:O-methyltransferase
MNEDFNCAQSLAKSFRASITESDRICDHRAADLYLDLMKRCLTDSIYADDPLARYVLYQAQPSASQIKRRSIELIQRMLSLLRLRLVKAFSIPWVSDYSALSDAQYSDIRERGTRWPVRAHTMIGLRRLENLQFCGETVIRDGIDGDFIETGAWRGGASIFMRAILKAHNDARNVWVADSFEGLPLPNATAYAADAGDRHHTLSPWLACSQEEVEANFKKYGLLDNQVRFLKGWFKDTLPAAPIEKLAVLRLDGDMYESTIQALDALYDKLSPGGFVIVDDYFLKPCAQAIHDFRNSRDIDAPIIDIDGMGAYWRR